MHLDDPSMGPTRPIMTPAPDIRDDLVICEMCITDRPRGVLWCQACGHTRVVSLRPGPSRGDRIIMTIIQVAMVSVLVAVFVDYLLDAL